MKDVSPLLEKLHIPYWVINLASITILLPVFLVCFHVLEFYLVKYNFEAELSKNEAQEICGHLSDAGKYQFEYMPKKIDHIINTEIEPASLSILCFGPNKSKQPRSIINHPILVAKLLAKENKTRDLSALYGEKVQDPRDIDLPMSVQVTGAVKNKPTAFDDIYISGDGIPYALTGGNGTPVSECKSPILKDSLNSNSLIKMHRIYNDYFVKIYNIDKFKHSRSEIAVELIKIADCLNRTESNAIKNEKSWQ